MFDFVEVVAILLLALVIGLASWTYHIVYHATEAACEKHFPEEVRECMWSAKYRVNTDG